MSNYYGTARSNYFRFIPTQLELLTKIFIPDVDIQVIHQAPDLVAIISMQDQGTPSACIDTDELDDALYALGVENADNVDDLDIRDVLHLLLPPGETLIWIEVGNERARYLIGHATCYDHTGQPLRHIDLNEIYTPEDTRAEY